MSTTYETEGTIRESDPERARLRRVLEEKTRTYERIHEQWMETNLFNEEARMRVGNALRQARAEKVEAYKALYPTHIVF